MSSTKPSRLKGYLRRIFRKKLPEGHKFKVGQLDEALKTCEKYFFDEIEFEYKGMKVKVSQEGTKLKALNIIGKNFDKAKDLTPEQVQKLWESM